MVLMLLETKPKLILRRLNIWCRNMYPEQIQILLKYVFLLPSIKITLNLRVKSMSNFPV